MGWKEETTVVLDYTECRNNLANVSRDCPEPMLPIGNKPLIQHQLEWLCDAGFKLVHVSLPRQHAGEWVSLLRHFRFGLKLSHSFHDGLAHFDECRRVFLSSASGVLWLSGYSLCRLNLPDNLHKSSLFIRAGEYVPVTYLRKRDVFLLMPQLSRLEQMSWQNLICEVLPDIHLEVVGGFMAQLYSPWEYQRVNNMVLANQTPFAMRQATRLKHMVAASRPHLGKRVSLLNSNVLGDHVAIGAKSVVDSCVLGDRTFLDECAQLKNCIVAPDTYIGKGIHLENKFICGAYIYDFGNCTSVRSTDRHFCVARQEATHPLVALISKMLLRARATA